MFAGFCKFQLDSQQRVNWLSQCGVSQYTSSLSAWWPSILALLVQGVSVNSNVQVVPVYKLALLVQGVPVNCTRSPGCLSILLSQCRVSHYTCSLSAGCPSILDLLVQGVPVNCTLSLGCPSILLSQCRVSQLTCSLRAGCPIILALVVHGVSV